MVDDLKPLDEETVKNAIKVPELCKKHQWLLVRQAGYKESDNWRGLLIVAQIVLFQAATATDRTAKKIGKDIHNVETLGCLACHLPDVFGELVEVAKSHDFGKLKAFGESFVFGNKENVKP